MKRLLKFFPLIFLILYCLPSNSQTKDQLFIGEDNSYPSNYKIRQILGNNDNGLYTLIQSSPYSLKIARFNEQYKEEKQAKIDLSESNNNVKTFECVILSNNKLFLFSSFRSVKTKMRDLYMQTINKETLELNNDIRTIISAEEYIDGKGQFDFCLSRDKSKILIFSDFPNGKDSISKLPFYVFDADMNKIYSKDILINYTEKVFTVGNFFVENNGDINLVGIVFSDKIRDLADKEKMGAFVSPTFLSTDNFMSKMISESQVKKLKYSYCVASYSQDGSQKEFFVNLSKRYIRDMRVFYDKEGNLLCSGFYSDKGITSINGSYFVKINGDTKTIEKEQYNEFSTDFISSGMTKLELNKLKKAQEKGKDVELYQVDLENVIFNEDGSCYLIGQQYFNELSNLAIGVNFGSTYHPQVMGNGTRVIKQTTESYAGAVVALTMFGYYERKLSIFRDIIVIKLDSEGNQVWAAKVPKKQKIIDDKGLFSSYSVAYTKNNIYFLFNDNPLNLRLKEDQEPYAYNAKGESIAMMSKVDKATGSVEIKPLFSSKEYKITLRPRLSYQINNNTLLICGQMYTHYKFGKLILE